MTDRYCIVEDPDGHVSVAVNHEVKVQPSVLANSPQCLDIDMGHRHRAATVLGDSSVVILSRRGRVDMLPRQQEQEQRQRPGIGMQVCAFVLVMCSVVNVSVHKEIIDIISVILSCFTLLAIRYDVGFLSKCQLAIHASFAMGVIIILAIIYNWGRVAYQVGCMSLCIFCLMSRK